MYNVATLNVLKISLHLHAPASPRAFANAPPATAEARSCAPPVSRAAADVAVRARAPSCAVRRFRHTCSVFFVVLYCTRCACIRQTFPRAEQVVRAAVRVRCSSAIDSFYPPSELPETTISCPTTCCVCAVYIVSPRLSDEVGDITKARAGYTTTSRVSTIYFRKRMT